MIEAVGSVEELGTQIGLILAADGVESRDLLFVLARVDAAGSERLWEPGRGAA